MPLTDEEIRKIVDELVTVLYKHGSDTDVSKGSTTGGKERITYRDPTTGEIKLTHKEERLRQVRERLKKRVRDK